MGAKAAVVWDSSLLGYDLGGDHPLHPIRLELTIRLAGSSQQHQNPADQLSSLPRGWIQNSPT